MEKNLTIKIKTGKKSRLASAGVTLGEMKYTTDTKEMFIGDGESNVRISATIIETTYAALKALRDAGGLTPGQQYRITDYMTTVDVENAQSAGHPFDLIVVADSVCKLNENARACLHEGDTYFANSKLEAWQVWYDIDRNPFSTDISYDGIIEIEGVFYYRLYDSAEGGYIFLKNFNNLDPKTNMWFGGGVDAIDGTYYDETGAETNPIIVPLKGYIYRMIDEHNNDLPFDFKNIQFSRYYNSSGSTFAQQYSREDNGGVNTLFYVFDYDGADASLSKNVYNNTIKGGWDFVFIGNSCYDNTFGDVCYENTFGNSCNGNTFGYGCSGNTFGNSCNGNTFGNGCSGNTFGITCQQNTFGDSCSNNTFGDYCNGNTFGNNNYENTFGNGCSGNTFGITCQQNTFGDSCSNNTFGDYCFYNKITGDTIRYIYLDNGMKGASDANPLELYDSAVDSKTYQISFKRSASGRYLMLWATDTGAMTGKYKAAATDLSWTEL